VIGPRRIRESFSNRFEVLAADDFIEAILSRNDPVPERKVRVFRADLDPTGPVGA